MPIFSMGKTIFSSLFKKPATISYPLQPKVNMERTRGHVENEIEKCIFCGICKKRCPTGAIDVIKGDPDSTWSIERFQCIQCNCCVEVCPKKCLIMDNTLTEASYTLTKDVQKYARVSPNPKDN